MAPVSDRENVGNYLGYLLRRARLRVAHLVALLQDAGTDGSDVALSREYAILLVLSESGGLSQHRLSEQLDVNRSVMVKVIDDLEAREEVVRARDAGDRRSYALSLGPAAPERLADMRRHFDALSRDFTAPLGGRERSRLVALLAELVAPSVREPLPAELLTSPIWLVITAHSRMESFGDEVLAPFGLSMRTYIALAVCSGGAETQTELASHMMIGPAATVDLVDDLERRGAVRRMRSTTDRRSYRIEPTPEGTTLAAAARAAIREAAPRFTDAFGPRAETKVTELIDLLVRLDSEVMEHH